MTIKELIKVLKKFKPNAEVGIQTADEVICGIEGVRAICNQDGDWTLILKIDNKK